MADEYKKLKEFPYYRIYSNGKIYSEVSNRYLKWHYDTHGYQSVKLYRGSKATIKEVKVHILVALLFVPNPNNYKEVNHIDRNKCNNDYRNLEWCNRSYNVNYDLEQRQKSGQQFSPLSVDMVKLIPELLSYNFSIKLISTLYKVGHITIRNIITGKTWGNLHLQFPKKEPFNRGIIEIPLELYNKLKSFNIDNTVLSNRIIPINSVTHRN